MATDRTSIAWTDATWSPVRGCSRVSPGCDSCYAMKMAHRFSGKGQPYEGLTRIGKRGVDWAGFARLVPEQLDVPLRWRKPRRIFVNSMSDLFHESLEDADILRVFDVMRQCPQHTFQILTKRAARMRDVCSRMRFDNDGAGRMWLASQSDGGGYRIMGGNGCTGMPWVWLGVSAEDQPRADERIPHLLATPAAVRFVSVEPQIGPVDLTYIGLNDDQRPVSALLRHPCVDDGPPEHGIGLDWVIVGGESGPKARPFDLAWARSLVAQCKAASVAVFVKQLGARPRMTQLPEWYETTGAWSCEMQLRDGAYWPKFRDRAGADPSEWPEDLRVREFPQ